MARFSRRRFGSATVAAALVAMAWWGSPASAGGPYVASRVHAGGRSAKQAAAMRIGSLDAATRRQESSGRALTSSSAGRLLVRQGLTPAGGLTVELDGRFTTQVVVEARGSASRARCADPATPDGH